MKKLLLLGGIVTAFFCACNSPKRVAQHYEQFKGQNREKFAKDCADNFPPQSQYAKGKPDTVTKTVQLPPVVIDCPPPDPKTGKATVTCPPCKERTNTIYQTDTIKLPNTAREEELRLRADRLQDEANKAREAETNANVAAEEWKDKAKTRFWIIAGIVAAAIGAFILKLKKII